VTDNQSTPETRARAAAKIVADAVNEMSFDVESFADELMRQHRTIQQNVFGAFMGAVRAWASLAGEDRFFDARNEFTVRASKQIVDTLGKYGTKPPFI
jgi:hypothetical protein